MEQIGYSLIDDGNNELEFWGDTPGRTEGAPNVIQIANGDRVHCPTVGDSYQGVRLVPRMFQFGQQEDISFDGTNIVVTRIAPAPPEPGTKPPVLVASALSITVSNGDISGVDGAFNLVAAIYLDVGQYMLLFLAPQPDASYFALVSGSAPNFTIAEQTADYIIIQAMTDSPGSPIDPERFSVQVFRMEA